MTLYGPTPWLVEPERDPAELRRQCRGAVRCGLGVAYPPGAVEPFRRRLVYCVWRITNGICSGVEMPLQPAAGAAAKRVAASVPVRWRPPGVGSALAAGVAVA